MTTKIKLRESLRAQRAALTPEEQRYAANLLLVQVSSSRLFRASQQVACYFANDGEIDTFPIIEKIWLSNKICYLPVISHLSWDHLWFAPFTPDTDFVLNRYGIPEPDIERRYWIRAQNLDLILMPLVAFDLKGNRLGMGGGFYDRSLAFLKRRQHWRRPHLVGLAHDFQHVKTITGENWDVPIQAIATEKNYYIINELLSDG